MFSRRKSTIAPAVVALLMTLTACSGTSASGAGPSGGVASSQASTVVNSGGSDTQSSTQSDAASPAGHSPASTSGQAPSSSVSADAATGNGRVTLKTVTFVNPLPDNAAWGSIAKCMGDEATAKGIKFTNTGPSGGSLDTHFMLDRLQQAISTKASAIVTFPVSVAQFDPIFKQANDAGILTAAVEGGTTKNNNVNVGTSWSDYGQLAAKGISKQSLGQKHQVGMITEGPTGPAADFVNGFKKYASDHSEANITVVDVRYDNGQPTDTGSLARAMLTTHPDLNMFVTNEGSATQPLVSVIEQKGLKGKVFVTTSNSSNGALPGMKAGVVSGILLQDMCDIGKSTIGALIDLSAGKNIPKNVATKTAFGTPETIDQLTAAGTMQ